jgi:geranylgeranyl diphosphate synthase type II
MTLDVPALLARHTRTVDAYLEAALRASAIAPAKLIEAMHYSLFAGGKRLRPALVLETAAACGGGESQSALVAAGAMELIHTFSLVHDDLPAMDDDDTRRGKPTNHKVFGEAMAILAGDAMMTLAFELLAVDAGDRAAPLIIELARASGPAGMIGGQVLDMAGEGQTLSLEQLQQIHRLKTGALLTASCRMGAIAAGAPADIVAAVTAYGRHIGLAFQIVDDILDETATPAQMGKATGKDRERGKNTYPALLGLDASRAEAAKQVEAAVAAVAPLGERGQSLAALARFVIERSA